MSRVRRRRHREVAPAPDPGEQAREIARRLARRRPGTGRLVVCQPSAARAAVHDRDHVHSAGKLIYDTEEAARWTALAIAGVTGEEPMNVYVCSRSRHGHCHLTRKPQRPPATR